MAHNFTKCVLLGTTVIVFLESTVIYCAFAAEKDMSDLDQYDGQLDRLKPGFQTFQDGRTNVKREGMKRLSEKALTRGKRTHTHIYNIVDSNIEKKHIEKLKQNHHLATATERTLAQSRTGIGLERPLVKRQIQHKRRSVPRDGSFHKRRLRHKPRAVRRTYNRKETRRNKHDSEDQCKDEGVWILDGLINCRYLHVKGIWGIDKDAKRHCTTDRNTRCCQTCRKLGFNKGSSGPETTKPPFPVPSSVTLVTQAPPARNLDFNKGSSSSLPPLPAPPSEKAVTEAPPGNNMVTKAPPDNTMATKAPPGKMYSSDKSDDQCKDEGVWIMGGLIACKYLYTKGIWGINTQAKQRCTSDPNTKCCKTCREIGFNKGSTIPLLESTKPPSQAPPLETTVMQTSTTDQQFGVNNKYSGPPPKLLSPASQSESLVTQASRDRNLGYNKGFSGLLPETPVPPSPALALETPVTTVPPSSDKTDDHCIDEGVWIMSGLIACKYLYKKGIWGINTQAKQRCTSDPNTKCCKTCRELGFNKGSPGPLPKSPKPPSQVSPWKTVVTQAPHDRTLGYSKWSSGRPPERPVPPLSMPPSTVPPNNVPSSDKPNDQCKDEGVWIMSGLIACKYLYTYSIWGINTQAQQYCTSDTNTKCCKTCRELGFSEGSSDPVLDTPTQQSPATPLKTMVTQAPPADRIKSFDKWSSGPQLETPVPPLPDPVSETTDVDSKLDHLDELEAQLDRLRHDFHYKRTNMKREGMEQLSKKELAGDKHSKPYMNDIMSSNRRKRFQKFKQNKHFETTDKNTPVTSRTKQTLYQPFEKRPKFYKHRPNPRIESFHKRTVRDKPGVVHKRRLRHRPRAVHKGRLRHRPTEVHKRRFSREDKCEDEGVWIMDGLIDCKYLWTRGIWGIDREAKKRCTSDRNTNCCKTCTKLGYGKKSSGPKPTPPVAPPQPSETSDTQAPSDRNLGYNKESGPPLPEAPVPPLPAPPLETAVTKPLPGNSVPSSGNSMPSSGNSVPSSGNSVPSSGNSVSSSDNSVSSSGNSVSSSVKPGEKCSKNPCQNGGLCFLDNDATHKCACTNFYGTSKCEKEIEKCDDMGCTNIGSCLSYLQGTICVCDGLLKQFCRLTSKGPTMKGKIESVLSEALSTDPRMVVASYAVLALLGLCLLIHCCRVKAKRHQLREAFRASIGRGAVPDDMPPDFMALSKSMCCCRGGETDKQVVVTRKKSEVSEEKTKKKKKKKKKNKDKESKKKRSKSKISEKSENKTSNSLRRNRSHDSTTSRNYSTEEDNNTNAYMYGQQRYYNDNISRGLNEYYQCDNSKYSGYNRKWRETQRHSSEQCSTLRGLFDRKRSHKDQQFLYNYKTNIEDDNLSAPLIPDTSTADETFCRFIKEDGLSIKRGQPTSSDYDPIAVMSLLLPDNAGHCDADSNHYSSSEEETIYLRK